MRVALILLLSASTLAAAQTTRPEAPAGPTESERAAQAAKMAQKAAEGYSFTLEARGGSQLKLDPKPLLQWSNPVVGSIHGAVFVWTGKGRPEVVASIYKWYGPTNFHLGVEFHSLAVAPLSARNEGLVVWSPRDPGIRFAPVPGAPAPADSPAARLRQMRALAAEFAASETTREGVIRELRRLTQPIYRYVGTDPADGLVDGALFAFVEGTDPEVFLLLEARRRGGGDGVVEWDYALARMNSVSLRVAHKGKEVWSLPEMPWSVVFGHGEPYTVFMFDPGQGVVPPEPVPGR
jgi:hypothetical protein